MKNTSLCLSAILAAGLCAGSCVDPAYDLSNLNTEVNLPPVELPIGSVNNLTLGDILKIEDEDGIMKNFQRYAQNTINEILRLEPQYQNYQLIPV